MPFDLNHWGGIVTTQRSFYFRNRDNSLVDYVLLPSEIT